MNTGSEIAIIGMAGRFPGAANVQEFWHNLKNGVESIHFFNREELLEAGEDSNVVDDPMYIKANAFIEDKEYFDASFFGYLPSEANLTDPQIRLFHEECWKALEDAGYGIPGPGNRIGLFAGAASNVNWEVYATLINMNGQVDNFTAAQLRNARYLNTRISYALNLSGPSVFIDTACSTSLVAVHQACNSLLLGECSMALAGGVSLGYNSRSGYLYQEGMINSKDGHCRAFDENASGTIIGEGAAVVVLKKLKDAIKDNDHIYAVIKASCINNDGNDKVGYTAPSIEGQATVIKTAQNWAKTPVESISYVEAHGTGTPLGDPIEIAGLIRAFNTGKKQFCAIGSVKTNIGHLDAAAGVAGLIKTVMSLKHRQLPPSLHFRNPNPKIDFANSPFFVNTKLRDWKNDLYPLRAGVSSFGIGGTNAHVIVEESPVRDKVSASRNYQLLVFSAKTPWSLEKNIGAICSYLEINKQEDLADIAYTLQTGRSSFNYRQAVVCSSHDEAIELLPALQQSATFTNNNRKQLPLVIFMFSGQGSQYAGMCRDLYQKETIFRNQVDHCCRLIKEKYDKDLFEIIFPEYEDGLSTIDNTEYTQPALFIIEYALAQLLISWGMNPDIMIGHSIGEYTAACISGVFALEDALHLVIKRGELMQELPAGKMLSISASERELADLLMKFPRISLAAVNSPGLCTVSGKGEWIELFKKEAEQAGFVCRPVRTSHAFHSSMMEDMLDEFRRVLSSVKMQEPQIPFVSNLTGKEATSDVVFPDYWVNHLRDTVQFSSGIEHLIRRNRECIFIEVGPGKVLSSLVLSNKNVQSDHTVVNLVKHVKETGNDVYHLLQALAVLWKTGITFQWERFYEDEQRCKVSLPAYVFEKTKYTADVDAAKLLFSEQLRSGYKRNITESIHISSWQRSLLPNKIPDQYTDKSAIVIVSGKENVSKHLGDHLVGSGRKVIQVRKDGRFNISGENILQAGNNDWDAVWEHIQRSGLAISHIIYCATVDEASTNADYQDIENTFSDGYIGLCKLAASLAGIKQEGKINITVISNDTVQVVDEDRVNPLKSCLIAPAKIIPMELLHVTSKVVDIPYPFEKAADEHRYITAITDEMDYETSDAVIAYRYFQRWVPSYSLLEDDHRLQSGTGIERNGVYIITGGFGGMGLTIARDLLTEHNSTVVLLHRSFFPAKKDWQTWLKENNTEDAVSKRIIELLSLEAGGGTVDVYQANVGIENEVQAFFEYAKSKYDKIHGIVWAAGEVDFGGIIQNRDDRGFVSYITSKVHGLLLFNKYFDFAGLDFLALFSSIGNVFYETKFGQVAYNAANEFLESFSYYARRKWGIHAFTINWCDWLNVGMTVKTEMRRTTGADIKSINARIEDGIYPAEGIAAFHKCLQSKAVATVIYKGNLQEAVRAGKAKYKAVLAEMKASAKDVENESSSSSTKEEQLLQLFQDFFGKSAITPGDDFFELGGDSLKAMTFVARINQSIGCSLLIADLYKHPTAGELAACLEGVATTTINHIPPAPLKKHYVLSAAQKRMYFIQQLDKSSIAYNEFQLLRLEGAPDVHKIETTFIRLIERHESLRTSFMWTHNGPVQIPTDTFEFKIEQHEAGNEKTTGELIRAFIRPFDLEQAPLLRAGLIKVSSNEHILLVDMHHIIADGVSIKILISDFMALYNRHELPALTLQYKDYAEWQQSSAEQERIAIQRSFWLNEFDADLTALELPADYSRPAVKSTQGNYFDFSLTPVQTAALRNVAVTQGASMFMVLMAAYNIMLSKLSNQDDIVIGIPTAGRRHTDVEGIIGMFVNTLPVRNHIKGSMTFTELLGGIKSKMLMALENQEYQYEDLIDNLKLPRDMSHNPLFDVLLSYQHNEDSVLQLPGLKITSYNNGYKASKFDLSLVAWESAEELRLSFEYSTALFRHETIQRFAGYMLQIIKGVVNNAGCKIADMNILAEPEKHKLLHDFNNTSVAINYPENVTIVDLFEEQVKRSPESMAVCCGNRKVTYAQLNGMAESIAGMLLEQTSPEANDTIAFMADPSIEMIAIMLAILKMGCAYVALSPEAPVTRNQLIYADCQAKLLVVQKTVIAQKADAVTIAKENELFIVDEDTDKMPLTKPVNKEINKNERLIYIIYTSGSTGKPKGVEVRMSGIVNMVRFYHKAFALKPGEKLSQVANICFDASAFEIWPALTGGGLLYIASPDIRLDAHLMEEWLISNQIEFTFQPPAIAERLLKREEIIRSGRLKVMNVAGDVLNYYPKEKLPFKLFNLYGPTEDSVWTTWNELRYDKAMHNYSIGKPIANKKVYIVDKHNKLLPVGVPGELCISGKGLAKGYLNNETLTQQKFINNPFGPGEIMYKTGDLAKWSYEGEIEFLGRIDTQVKIRGFRIEIGEIEASIKEFDKISEAAVVVHGENEDKVLVVYYSALQAIDAQEIKKHLAEQLPDYMVPSFFIHLPGLPYTVSGKLDRKSLPSPVSTVKAASMLPVNDVQKQLVAIWSGILGIEAHKIGITDNFFDIGGNSIRLMSMVEQLNARFNTRLSIAGIFKFPEIRTIANYIIDNTQASVHDNDRQEEGLAQMRKTLNVLNRI